MTARYTDYRQALERRLIRNLKDESYDWIPCSMTSFKDRNGQITLCLTGEGYVHVQSRNPIGGASCVVELTSPQLCNLVTKKAKQLYAQQQSEHAEENAAKLLRLLDEKGDEEDD